MAHMWRGPCEALKKASDDPLWAAIHRRNGRQLICCQMEMDGRSALFYRLEKGTDGEWYRYDLGRAEGADPYLTSLWGSHRFTAFDAELLALHLRYVLRLAEEIDDSVHAIVNKLGRMADEFLP